MSNDELLDPYSDYLLSAFGQTTATGLSALLGGQVSHDQIQRFLAGRQRTSADLWRIAKPHVRKIDKNELYQNLLKQALRNQIPSNMCSTTSGLLLPTT